jgi:NADH:ubiquinone oxidoreductase subunit 4 (subunit M)
MTGFPILSIVVFTPLIGALIVAIAPSRYARSLALAASLVAWLISLLLLIGFEPNAPAGRTTRRTRRSDRRSP